MTKKIHWPSVIRSYFYWVFMPMASLFVLGYALNFVFPTDPEGIEKAEWCKEYHPDKSWYECSKIAGW